METDSNSPDGDFWKFLSQEWAPARKPRIGRRLYHLARQAGLRDIEVEAHAKAGTDSVAEMAEERLMLDDWLSALQETGEVTETEAEAWL